MPQPLLLAIRHLQLFTEPLKIFPLILNFFRFLEGTTTSKVIPGVLHSLLSRGISRNSPQKLQPLAQISTTYWGILYHLAFFGAFLFYSIIYLVWLFLIFIKYHRLAGSGMI